MQKIIFLIMGSIGLLSTSASMDSQSKLAAETEIVTPDILVSKQMAPVVKSASKAIEKSDSAELPKNVLLKVPFTSQAPHGNWNVPYGEACEEAALISVQSYLDAEDLNSEIADKKILDLVDWENKNNFSIDISTKQVAEIAKTLYAFQSKIYYDEEINIDNIKRILADGNPIIIPVAGHMLGNPNFTGLGPPYHMLTIVGYDEKNFITHDPGTRLGKNYQYSFDTIIDAIHDWNGSKSNVKEGRKAVLVLTK